VVDGHKRGFGEGCLFETDRRGPAGLVELGDANVDEIARLEHIGRGGSPGPRVALPAEICGEPAEPYARRSRLGGRDDDRGHDVSGDDRPIPAIVLELVDGLMLGDDVPRWPPPPMALVVGPQAG